MVKIETIIAALISAAAAIVVSFITSNVQHRKILAELEKQDTLQAERIDNLKVQVEKHNSMVERTYQLEQRTAVIDEQIKVANHRISDLENKQ